MEAIRVVDYKGYHIRIYNDPDPLNPRTENENLGKMFCQHGRYLLGDFDLILSDDERRKICNHIDYIALPLFLYDHTGITINTEPFYDRFDSGKVGFTYCHIDDGRKAFPDIKDEKELREKIKEVLEAEVQTYDQYLRNDIYGYRIFPRDPWDDSKPNPEELESCWDFYGLDYCLQEAKSVVDSYAEEKIKEFIPGLEPEELRKVN